MTISNTKNQATRIHETAQALVEALAQRFADLAQESIRQRGKFTAALSGGSTPKALYERLAKPPFSNSIEWEKARLFLGDERCVSHADEESNYRMIDQALLSKIPVPSTSAFPTQGQDKDPQGAAQSYEQTIRTVFQSAEGVPVFDLVLLGLGPDGHTASLFPGSKAIQEHKRLYIANFVEKFDSWRLTMTYPLLKNARNIVFLVSGPSKAAILADVFKKPEKKYPAQAVHPINGNLEWFIDKDAAKLLSS